MHILNVVDWLCLAHQPLIWPCNRSSGPATAHLAHNPLSGPATANLAHQPLIWPINRLRPTEIRPQSLIGI